MFPVVVVPYDPAWPRMFDAERARINSVLADLGPGLEHIGSTSVPDLAAKPKIDIVVGLRTWGDRESAIDRLSRIGYEHEPQLSVPRHFSMKRGRPTTHRVHLVEMRGGLWQDYLAFRDALRADVALRARYGALKQELALRHRDDHHAYMMGKASFIEAAIDQARRAGRGGPGPPPRASDTARGTSTTTIETVTGPVDGGDIELALPHEHLFVDLLGPTHPDYGRVDWAKVRNVCVERLAALRRLGVDLLVDCTAIGIGRNVGLLREVSETTGVRIVCATGIYKGHVPPELSTATPDELAERFISELTTGVDGSAARAGIIKLATTETGPTPRETEVHRAGARAAAVTGCVIVLHSPSGQVTRDVLATLEGEGFDPARLIWAHAQDSTPEENLELAARGVTISLDAIGVSDDSGMVDRIERLVEAGHADRILVSTDTSVWVNPPEMAYERSIEHLLGTFVPLVATHLGADLRDRLVRGNVLRALGRPRPSAMTHLNDSPLTSKEE